MNAAMLMAKASSLLHHLAKSIDDPGELLSRVNNEICESISHGMFVTLVSGFLDAKNQTIKFSNAGHQPPLFHTNKGEFIEIEASAPPIGIIPAIEFPVETINLNGGVVYLFTDGITEIKDPSGEMLGAEGFQDYIKKYQSKPNNERLKIIIEDIVRSGKIQKDDLTIVVIDGK